MKFYIKLIIGLVLCGILIYFVDWQKTSDVLLRVSIITVFAAFVVLSTNIFTSSLKWYILLKAHNVNIPLWELTRIYWISTFLGNYLPTNFGGDVFRVVMLKHLGHTATIAASIAVERITGFIILIAWSVIALLMRPEYFSLGNLLFFLWMAVGGFSLILVGIWFWGGGVSKLLHYFEKKISSNKLNKIILKIIKLSDSMAKYKKCKRELFLSFALSVVFYSVLLASNYLVLMAVGVNLSVKEVALIVPIIPLVSLLPISLNGLGVSEGAFILFFSQAGVQPSEALAAALIRRVVHLLVSLIGFIFWLPKRAAIALQKDNLQ
ncbi:MAG: flippase-like domain-containing protein [Gammaproteobacteria bacterium]|nr:flippase-like domain-containing protein [Gammaproteobacteria bacterium]